MSIQDEVHPFDRLTVYGDLATNHHGSKKVYDELVRDILRVGAIPKIQLYSAETFDRTWDLPQRFAASIFRPSDLDYIMPHSPQVLKVASVESTHFELIQMLMATELPLIISTGGLDDDELLQLMDTVQGYEHGLCLMHCVSKYPTLPDQCNMHRISTLADMMDELLMIPWVGWSCHTRIGYTHPLISALTQGASQLEFHVMLNRTVIRTDDENSSLQLADLDYVMNTARATLQMLGTGEIEQDDREQVLQWRARWQDLTS